MSLTLNVDLGSETVELELRILRVGLLKPHEEIVYSNYRELYDLISKSGFFFNPIIVDRSSLTVLDGMHRLAAAKSLGLAYVPAMALDYFSDYVRVDVWTKAFRGDVDKALKLLLDMDLKRGNGEDCLLVGQNETIGFEIPAQSVTQKYKVVRSVLSRLQTVFGEPTPTKEAEPKRGEFFFTPPKLSKNNVVEAGANKTLFPPKTTRHILKARIVEAPVPLTLLKHAYDTRQEEFLQHISKVKVLEGKSFYGNRYYDDDKIIVLNRY
ncbi:MAG: ParB N-terminal domain-containing protein [Thermoprotei archaeon]